MHVTLNQAQHGDSQAGVVAVFGEVDADNCGEFRTAILERAPEGEQVVVDLSGLSFIDSSGISELLRIASTLDEQGRTLTIHDPSPAVQRVLEITGLLDHFGLA
jgi:anti-anti-sigma factor